ncbi:polymer-forming cytoskeletal protein [Kalamiella sp. sgz302252]|uniref:bactofilin family protein n=1 Tax=Pantoea sp. sgz302252 TaxID=3341827 RepID=UPI0036D2B41C
MNYNLLWYLWIIWASALVVYSLSWATTLMLIRQHRGLLIAAASAVITWLAFRKITLNKEMTMFKRKENPLQSTPTAPLQYGARPQSAPPENSNFEETVSAATVVSVANTPASGTTTIPDTCTIVGEISAAGDIHITGSVSGKVNSEKTVFVQKDGRVEGEIWAQRTEISGELKGLCCSREVAINANGFMDGTIECESLSINQQGKFYGQSKPYKAEKEPENNVVKSFVEPLVPPSQDFHLRDTAQ